MKKYNSKFSRKFYISKREGLTSGRRTKRRYNGGQNRVKVKKK